MAAVADRLKSVLPSNGISIPKGVEERVNRAKTSMKSHRSKVNEAYEFWRGNQYVFVNNKNYLVQQGTVTNPDGSGKPRHRARQAWNLIHPIVEAKVSLATQRVPGYEVVPATSDPEDIAASRTASKVAIYGYEQWGLRRVTTECVTHALVAGEGFAMPYFDTSIGPFVQDVGDDGKEAYVGQGDIRVKVLSKNEVGWEDGCEFEDSPWFVIVQGRTVEQVKSLPNYVGPQKLELDAKTSEILGRSKQGEKLVLVFEYVERPNPDNRDGLRLTIANGRVVTNPEAYPCRDSQGNVADMPVLHRLSYTVDPEQERDRGLVPHLIDPQRVFNDCNNKLVEWKNLCLFPQWVVSPGTFQGQKRTDEPGAVYQIAGDLNSNFKQLDPPTIPNDLYRIKEEARQAMLQIASANDIPNQVESGKGIQAVLDQAEQSWAQFVSTLSSFHSSLMRHALYLVQHYYNEERLIKVRGDFGWERIEDFRGASLKDQIDVRVLPGSLTPISKSAVEQKVMNIVQTFPGWIEPERAVRAIESGNAEDLIKGYEAALGRVNSIIQRMREGMDALEQIPPRPVFPGEQIPGETKVDPQTGEPIIDPATGQPETTQATEVPGWMPRPFDAIPVHKKAMEDWFQSPDYENAPTEVQEVANLYYSALLQLEQQKAAEAAMIQQQTAEQAGLSNAAGPAAQNGSGPKPMPSLPALDRGQSAPRT